MQPVRVQAEITNLKVECRETYVFGVALLRAESTSKTICVVSRISQTTRSQAAVYMHGK